MKALAAGLRLGAGTGALMGGVEILDRLIRVGDLLGSPGSRLAVALQIFAATTTAGAVLGLLLGSGTALAFRLAASGVDLPGLPSRLNQALIAAPARDRRLCAGLALLVGGSLVLSLHVLSRGFLNFPLGPAALAPYAAGVIALVLIGLAAKLALGPRPGRPGVFPLSGFAWSVALLGLGLFGLLYGIDRDFYVRLYTRVHLTLAAAAYLSLSAALLAAFSGRPPGPARSGRWGAIGAALLWLASSAFTLVQFNANEEAKAFLFNRTTYAKRIFPLLARAVPAFRPRPIPSAAEAMAPSPVPRAPSPDLRGASLILITIDAVRADHTGFEGYARPTTPSLERFARGAVTFRRAYAQGAMTFPSVASLMTGRHPSDLHWTHGVGPPLDRKNLTLAEVLREAGYDTAAVTPHRYFGPRWGLAQGFTRHDNSAGIFNKDNRGIVSERLVVKSKKMLALLEPPFFLWVHFYDPHHHYMPREVNPFGERDVDLYDGELADTDRHIGELIAWLEANVRGPALTVVASDHGEEFGEHGGQFHGTTLYEEVTHVPLLMGAPGLGATEVEQAVSLVDVVPTILDVLRVGAPPGLAGRSLGPALAGRPLPGPGQPVFSQASQLASKQMVLHEGWKLIHDAEHDTWELYDLAADPGERRNLYHAAPEKVASLERLLLSRLGTTP
jgi:arylsulfatase A-like enzyme